MRERERRDGKQRGQEANALVVDEVEAVSQASARPTCRCTLEAASTWSRVLVSF